MVPLKFNTFGFAFEHGVDVLLAAYRQASEALQADYHRLKTELSEYETSLAEGKDPVGEWSEEGYALWTQDQILGLQIEDSEDALRVLRRSFVVAIYHHWERWVRRQLGCDEKAGHDKLVQKACAGGISIDPHLGGVRDMANLFKHSNKKWGTSLLSSWPDVLPRHFTPDTDADWYEAVRLSEEIVLEIADIVKASGPRTNETYWIG